MTIRHGIVTTSLLAIAGMMPMSAIATDLAEVYALAATADMTYQAAVSGHRSAIEVRPQAQSVLMPTVAFTASAARTKQHSTRDIEATLFTPATVREFSGSIHNGNYALSLTQPLFNLANWMNLRSADQQVLQADAELASARQELIFRTATGYFGVLSAMDSLEFAIAEKQAIQRQLDQARQRFEVGLIAITDVQESQAAFDLATADEIVAQNNVDVSREALRELTGEYHENLAQMRGGMPLLTPDPASIDEWTTAALKNNFELISLQKQVEASREQINVAKSGHLPTIDLVGTHSYNTLTGGTFGASRTRDNDIAVRLNWTLFQGGSVLSRTRAAQAQHQQLRNLLEGQQRVTQRDARSAYLGVVASISRVKALRQAVVSSKTAMEATESGFEVGTRTTVDVLDAQRDLFEAQRNYAQARYFYVLATLALRRAAGSLNDDDISAISGWLTPVGE